MGAMNVFTASTSEIAPGRRSYAERRRNTPPTKKGGCGNTNKLMRAWILRHHYAKRLVLGLRDGLSPADLLRTQFPFCLPDAQRPPTLGIELTNICNLRCSYCTSPVKIRPAGMMTEATFTRVLSEISAARIRHVAVCGNGEPTLHPRFCAFIRELGVVTSSVSLTTNFQRVTDEIILAILETPVSHLHISVDGGSAQEYALSRIGGNLEQVVGNIRRLQILRRNYPSKCLLNIRLHLRPSQAVREDEILAFWSVLGEKVSKQYVTDWAGVDSDVYSLACERGVHPKCTLPFKQLDLHWNGNVPLCSYSEVQSGRKGGLLLGNINTHNLLSLWNSPLMQKYRRGHRLHDNSLTQICEGCAGC